MKELQKKLVGALDSLSHSLYFKTGLLDYVYKHGFHISDYLRQKALLSINDEKQSKEKNVPHRGKGKRREVVEVPSDILHPELYKQLVQWRNEEASKQGVPVYLILRQQAILGISNLLPADTVALSRIPYLGRKTIEKYGEAILEIVRASR